MIVAILAALFFGLIGTALAVFGIQARGHSIVTHLTIGAIGWTLAALFGLIATWFGKLSASREAAKPRQWFIACASIALLIGLNIYEVNSLPSLIHARQQVPDIDLDFAEGNYANLTFDQAVAIGHPEALIKLGWLTVYCAGGIRQDVPKGIAILEKVAASPYPAAQYSLGWLLLDGRYKENGQQINAAKLPRDVPRGLELLKRSASESCTTRVGYTSYSFSQTAELISRIYREGKLIPADVPQADLWHARSLVHCAFPHEADLLAQAKSETGSYGVELLSQLLLLPSAPAAPQVRESMSDPDVQAAEQQAEIQRQAVLASEKDYPAPNWITRR